jgi:SagB-type dehydrogenase family enzyme
MEYYRRSPYVFTYWNQDGAIVLYNYNRHTKAVVSNEIMKILDMLTKKRNIQQISEALEIDKKDLTEALKHLVRLKMIHKVSVDNKDDLGITQVPWDPIDLAMQRQRSYGGRRPFSEREGKSPSPVKVVRGLSTLILNPPPNVDNHSNTFLRVLNERKSIRRYSTNKMSKDTLSHFLYHSARIKQFFRSKEGTLTNRTYPSGGARYPLEIYVSNNRISGIQKGIHYYDPLKHRLILLNKNKIYQKQFNSFLKHVQHPIMNREPDVVFIITAVFSRTVWKYDRLGVSLILSDLGSLYQTMYLVATELNLAPCPIGKTEEELVKNWLKLNWFEESHVGTFMLGLPEEN